MNALYAGHDSVLHWNGLTVGNRVCDSRDFPDWGGKNGLRASDEQPKRHPVRPYCLRVQLGGFVVLALFVPHSRSYHGSRAATKRMRQRLQSRPEPVESPELLRPPKAGAAEEMRARHLIVRVTCLLMICLIVGMGLG
jgi:hypothetical protein